MNIEQTPISNKNIFTKINFFSINETVPIPHLLKMSKSSYNNFLQRFISYENRLDIGLQLILKKYFGNLFICYSLGTSEYSPEECLDNGITYSIPLYVYLKSSFKKEEMKSDIQRYYLGEIPLLTESGSFIINGIENTIINQLVRDSGVYLNKTKSPFIQTSLKIRGLKGRSIQFDLFNDSFIGQKIDTKSLVTMKEFNYNVTHQEIDKLLDSLKITFREIGETFTYSIIEYKYCKSGWYLNYNWKNILTHRVVNKSKNILSFLNIFQNKLLNNLDYLFILNTIVKNKFIEDQIFYKLDLYLLDIYKDNKSIFQIDSKDLYDNINLKISLLEKIGFHISSFQNFNFLKLMEENEDYIFIFIDLKEQNDSLYKITQAAIELKKKKLLQFYKNIPFSTKILNNLLNKDSLFNKFILGEIGRLKINLKFGLDVQENELISKDLIYIIKYLIQLNKGLIEKDYYEEQNLLNKKFNNLGEQLFTCLNDYLMFFEEKKVSTFKYDYNMFIRKIQIFENSLFFLLRYLNKSSLCQYTEQANPLSYLAHTRKISIMGPGGLKSDNVSLEMRDVHISTYGRICPIETPEGKSVGIVNNLSIYTRSNKYYELETPYKIVKNGFVTNEIHYLTPYEEKFKKIARSTEILNKDGSFRNNEEIYCRYLHNLVSFKSKDVDYIEITPKQLVSISAGMIPFLEHNDGNRALMGSNMQKQAVPLTFLEKSLIGTGIESSVGRDFNNNNYFYDNYYYKIDYNFTNCINLHRNNIVNKITFNDLKDSFITNNTIKKIKKFINSNQKTNIDFIYKNLNNNLLFFKDILQMGYSLKNDELCLGNNVLVAFTSMNGHTFEDSIVISERMIREGYFNSIYLEVYKTMEVYEKDSQEIIKQINNNLLLDGDGVILVGQNVNYNDILISKEKRQLLFSEKNKLVIYDKSIRYKNKKKGNVIQVTKLFDSYEEINREYLNIETSQKTFTTLQEYIVKEEIFRLQFLKYFLKFNLKRSISFYKKMIFLNDLNLYFNYKMRWFFLYYNLIVLFLNIRNSSIFNNYKKYLFYYDKFINYTEILLDNYKKNILKELIKEDQFIYIDSRLKSVCKQNIKKKRILNIDKIKIPQMILLKENLKKINLLSVNRFVEYSLLQTLYALIILFYMAKYRNYVSYQYDNNIIYPQSKSIYTNKKKQFLRSNYTLKMVKIIIACQHNIQVGDKLTGRYGNKGVISRMLLIEEMPYLKDGTPVDIILNPLGVSSRMNIGQLLECHLGLAGIELSKKLQKIMSQYNDNLLNKIRIFLTNIYLNKKEYLQLNTLDSNQLIALSKNLIHGINISTSIFDSAKNKDIDNLLRISGLKIQNKVELIDGITGTLLDNNVTIGYMYMMKLNHLVDHKIHGRSTGPYNVITQQASKGKSKNGGQRLGEMEVWALQAYGAAYTLQEMLTFKSDSTISRSNFLQNFIRGKTYKIDIPRTFKLLRDELRVLGLELNFIVKRL